MTRLILFFACLSTILYSQAQILQGEADQHYQYSTGYYSCEVPNLDSFPVYFSPFNPAYNPDMWPISLRITYHGRIPCFDEDTGLYLEDSGALRFEGHPDMSFASIEVPGLSNNGVPDQHLVWRSFEAGEVVGPSTVFDPSLEFMAHRGHFPHMTDPSPTISGQVNEFSASDRYYGWRYMHDGEFHYGYGSLEIQENSDGSWTPYFNELYVQSDANVPIIVGDKDATILPDYIPLYHQIVDVNGDGLLDIAGLSTMHQVSTGEFSDGVAMNPLPYVPSWAAISPAIADLDGDGDMDFAGAGGISNVPSIPEAFTLRYTLLNDGSGNLSGTIQEIEDPSTWLPVDSGGVTSNVQITQNDTTNYMHFIVSSFEIDFVDPCESYLVTMESSQSAPEFNTTSSVLPIGGCFLPDFQYDLETANLIGGPEEEPYVSLLGHQLMIFDVVNSTVVIKYLPIDIYSTYVRRVELSDFDSDGYDDALFSVNHDINSVEPDGIYLSLNDGMGNFAPPVLLSSNYTEDLESADLDLDGDIDFIAMEYMNSTTWSIRPFLNNGSGSFVGLNARTFTSNGYVDRITIAPPHNGEPPAFVVAYLWDWDAPGPPGSVYIPLDVGCLQDIDNDGQVDVNDFLMYNSAFGSTCSGCPEDLTGDGIVDVNDFLMLNSAFNQPCQ